MAFDQLQKESRIAFNRAFSTDSDTSAASRSSGEILLDASTAKIKTIAPSLRKRPPNTVPTPAI
jgi:hypothetical protein